MPRALKQQRLSLVNVPLMWEAAGDSHTGPVLGWLSRVTSQISDQVHLFENAVSADEAVRIGWTALGAVFRSWHVASREDLTCWLREHRYPGAPGHISARAPEHVLQQACADARVGLLEEVFVVVAIHMGRQDFHDVPTVDSTTTRPRVGLGFQNQTDWSQMDHCQLEEMFWMRVLVLRSGPHFLRSRLRESFGMALRDRFRAQLHEDRDGEIRTWKLFALTPIMLLHKPKGRSELFTEQTCSREGLGGS